MKLPRFYFTEALIVLPFVAVLALTVFLAVRELPRFDQRERERIARAYHDLALEVRDGERDDIREMPLEGARTQGRLGKKGTWGFELIGRNRVRVWYRAPHAETRQAVEIAALAPENHRALYRNWAFALLIVVLLLTDYGLRRYRRFLVERDNFIAATAHDLNTPLVALRHLIGRDDEEAKLVVERMLRMVGNLTDYIKLGGRIRREEVVEFDLREAYEEAYRLLRDDFRALSGGSDVKVEGEGTTLVRAERQKTVQIFWNLLSNALKYGAPYGPVSVRFETDEKYARVIISDVGIGLSPSERRRVFDRYYRAKSVMKSGKGGFGIGLCTARVFARQMGGNLTVSSNTPKGSAFTLSLRRVG